MKRIIVALMCAVLTVGLWAQDYEKSENYGKRIAVFGGSFSEIIASNVTKAYWAEKLRARVTTYGIGGAGFSVITGEDRWLPGQIDRCLASGEKYDIYILWASTNDVTRGVELEEQDRMIKVCINKLREAAPEAKILFFSSLPVPLLENKVLDPAELESMPERFRENRRAMITNMKRLPEYVAHQEKVCAEEHVPFLNLYTTSGINEYNAPDFFGSDELHLNTAGYNHIKETQARFIAAN